MSFKEVKTSVDQDHSWYSNYRGDSVGRVLHYFYHYLGLHVADSIQVGNKQVTYRGKMVATINWDNGYPLFDFNQVDSSLNTDQIKQAIKLQNSMVVENEK